MIQKFIIGEKVNAVFVLLGITKVGGALQKGYVYCCKSYVYCCMAMYIVAKAMFFDDLEHFHLFCEWKNPVIK